MNFPSIFPHNTFDKPRLRYTQLKFNLGGRAAANFVDNYDALDSFITEEELLELEPLENLGGARVLILNASYEPLHVCSVKRAVALLMHDVAERTEDSARILRSPSQIFAVPSVIRLKKYVRRPPHQKVAFNRKNVFRRDEHTCQYCGLTSNDLTLDHVVPRSRKGPTSWTNVVACCHKCNAKKRDRTPDEANMALARKPFAPRFMFSSAFGILPNIDLVWEKYLPKSKS